MSASISAAAARLAAPGPAALRITRRVAADPADVFAAVTDFTAQGRWIPMTTVRIATGDGHSVGSVLHAVTGIAGLGVLDVLEVVAVDPPRSLEVVHTGRFIKGPAQIRVEPAAQGARLIWSEQLRMPGGTRLAWLWPLLRPAAGTGTSMVLSRFIRLVEEGLLPRGSEER